MWYRLARLVARQQTLYLPARCEASGSDTHPKSVTSFPSVYHWMTGQMWYTLGKVWSMEKNFAESERCYSNALATFRDTEFISYYFLGHRCLEGLEQALRSQQKAADADNVHQERMRIFGR